MEAQISLECIKRVRLNNYLWKSITGWNGPRKKRMLKCVNCRLEVLELSGMTSCCVLQTWYRMVLLWNFTKSISDLVHHGQYVVESAGIPIRDQTPSPIWKWAVCCIERECSSQIGLLSVESFPAYQYIFADVDRRRWNSIRAWDGR